MPNIYRQEKNIIKDRIQCWREIEIDHKKLKVSAISGQRSVGSDQLSAISYQRSAVIRNS